jgi:hypothetical protein
MVALNFKIVFLVIIFCKSVVSFVSKGNTWVKRNLFNSILHSSNKDAFVSPQKDDIKKAFAKNSTYTQGVDEKGYEIKARDWFNGLSSDPGDSLNDPRSVPPPAKEFAEKIKSGKEVSFKETMALIDEHYVYFEVPFTNGDLLNKANENTGNIICNIFTDIFKDTNYE